MTSVAARSLGHTQLIQEKRTGVGVARQPRPPVPGSEAEAFREKLSESAQNGMGYLGVKPASRASSQSAKMAPSPKATSESGASIGSGRDRGFEPEGSADITPPFSESNSNNSTPAFLRWVNG
jgi:hypothetical protein